MSICTAYNTTSRTIHKFYNKHLSDATNPISNATRCNHNRYNDELDKSQANWEAEVNAIISRRVMGKRKRIKEAKKVKNKEDFTPKIFKKSHVKNSLSIIEQRNKAE